MRDGDNSIHVKELVEFTHLI